MENMFIKKKKISIHNFVLCFREGKNDLVGAY